MKFAQNRWYVYSYVNCSCLTRFFRKFLCVFPLKIETCSYFCFVFFCFAINHLCVCVCVCVCGLYSEMWRQLLVLFEYMLICVNFSCLVRFCICFPSQNRTPRNLFLIFFFFLFAINHLCVYAVCTKGYETVTTVES